MSNKLYHKRISHAGQKRKKDYIIHCGRWAAKLNRSLIADQRERHNGIFAQNRSDEFYAFKWEEAKMYFRRCI